MFLRLLMEKYIIRLTRTMNLRGKLLLLYGLIVFIPTVILGIGAGYWALQSVRSNYLITIQEAVRQTAQSIEFRKQGYDLLATRTATDGELISRLSRDHEDMFDQLETVEYVDRSFLFTSKYLPGIEDFRIYHANATLVQDGQLLWKPENRMLSGLNETVWYNQTIQAAEPLRWTNAPDDSNKLVVTRKIINPYGDVYGVIYLLLDYNAVFGQLFDHPFKGAGQLYIIDEHNRIIASSDPDGIGNEVATSALQSLWNEQSPTDNGPHDGKQLIVRKLSSGWSVAALIHMDQLERQSKRILYGIIGSIAFFLLVSTFLIMTVLKNVVWRIRKLGTRMNDISQGEFDVTVRNRDSDELGELELLFNSMSGRLGKLVKEITQAHLKEKEQSFKALQAQINPHFIYNSLSLIRWRAMDLQDEVQVRTIDALTTFYRLALDNKVNVTRIQDELEHVRAYMEIQQLRYPNRVQVEWDVDPEALELYTIKLLLQPIVENSYLHGSITRKDQALIRISVQRVGDHVRFEVYDNGKGIAEEMLNPIRNGEQIGTGNGFGMSNIRERLTLYFGQDSLFQIQSQEKAWTLVTILIPACKERPEIRRGEGS